MAKLDAILIPGRESMQKSAGLAATTSTAEILVGRDSIYAFVATGAITIVFGNTGLAAASASNGWYVPANQIVTFDLGKQFTAFRIFNTTASAIDVYYGKLVA